MPPSKLADSETEPGKCHLLELPAELREYIYELALTEEEFIWFYFDNGLVLSEDQVGPYQEPGVLSACQQIRNEALPIYYKTNNFGTHICKHLGPKVIELEKKCKKLGVLHAMRMDVHEIYGPSWEGTLQWCEHVHSGGKWYPDDKEMEQLRRDEVMYCAALDMTKLLGATEWKICKQSLEILRYAEQETKYLP